MQHHEFKYALVDLNAFWDVVSSVYMVGDKPKVLLQSIPKKEKIATIDWLNVTFHESTIEKLNSNILGDYDLIIELSKHLQKIFGFSITSVRPNGAFFYNRSFEIGDKYGLVCHGGQAKTILISINATGLHHAEQLNPRCFNDFYSFISEHGILCTITRIDVAYDDYNSSRFTVESMLEAYKAGGFNNGKRTPSVSQAGNWITPDSSGRTLYIGKRTNGLFCRIYEKGLQLKDTNNPNWVRAEVEFKSVDRIIPFEILIKPEQFLAASYPVFSFLTEEQSKIKTFQHEIRADINHRTQWTKRQSGAFLNLLSELGYSNDQIVETLKRNEIPKPFRQKFIKTELTAIQDQPRSDFEPTAFQSEI